MALILIIGWSLQQNVNMVTHFQMLAQHDYIMSQEKCMSPKGYGWDRPDMHPCRLDMVALFLPL